MAHAAFIGSKDLGHRALRSMIANVRDPHSLVVAVVLDDRDDPRTAFDAIVRTARDAGVPSVTASTMAAAIAALERAGADVAIVCGWYQVLSVDRSPGIAFYGLHASLLPAYRGHAPVVWQIIDGNEEIGLTLFRLDAGIDTGPIVAQGTVPLARDETVADALSRLSDLAEGLIARELPAILDGTVQLTPQDERAASYRPRRRPEDGRIDWTWPSPRIHDFVRAQTRPYPGAFTDREDGRRIRIWRTAETADHVEIVESEVE